MSRAYGSRPGTGTRSAGRAAAPLVVRSGAAERTLTAGRPYLVGRDPDCDIVLTDPRVSWHHAVLAAEDSHWVLADDGSRNGTYAAGRRADRIEIDRECLVRLSHPADGPALSCVVGGAAGRALRIGRAPDNDIVVADPTVSSYHAELRTVAGGRRIVDLDSHNGTFVNEQRVTAALLTEGDVVGLGDATFRLAGGELRGHGDARAVDAPLPAAEPPEAGAATASSTSRTRSAGWCRGASGSRTSTS